MDVAAPALHRPGRTGRRAREDAGTSGSWPVQARHVPSLCLDNDGNPGRFAVSWIKTVQPARRTTGARNSDGHRGSRRSWHAPIGPVPPRGRRGSPGSSVSGTGPASRVCTTPCCRGMVKEAELFRPPA
ncbi:hypothetical protein RC1_3551 [Rhodospirillum centenum SW]|uniref:Uncharacterized protein n=1 Tax=Rhodospirillum centenum (strain ATCC 51521 / SW) TaxID=414684 RepID=B6IX80_RHOCS|nr:hypothetical protein RC1_3551 [Rhodospirillum centenum SW]